MTTISLTNISMYVLCAPTKTIQLGSTPNLQNLRYARYVSQLCRLPPVSIYLNNRFQPKPLILPNMSYPASSASSFLPSRGHINKLVKKKGGKPIFMPLHASRAVSPGRPWVAHRSVSPLHSFRHLAELNQPANRQQGNQVARSTS